MKISEFRSTVVADQTDKEVVIMVLDGDTNPLFEIDHIKEDNQKIYLYVTPYVDEADRQDLEIQHTAKVMSADSSTPKDGELANPS